MGRAFAFNNEFAEMEEEFALSVGIELPNGERAMRAENPAMVCQISVPDVRNHAIWTRNDDLDVARIMDILEKHVDTLTADLQVLKSGGHFGEAYPRLIGAGEWNKVTLFRGHRWDTEL